MGMSCSDESEDANGANASICEASPFEVPENMKQAGSNSVLSKQSATGSVKPKSASVVQML